MAVARSQRLAIVLDLALREKDAAAEQLERAQQLHNEALNMLQQLRDYYADYQRQFAQVQSMRVEDLVKQRGFLQQLNQAQQQQQSMVQQAQAQLQQKREAWQQAHLKHKNLAELIARLRADEQRLLDKKEQKLLDEWFTQSRGRR